MSFGKTLLLSITGAKAEKYFGASMSTSISSVIVFDLKHCRSRSLRPINVEQLSFPANSLVYFNGSSVTAHVLRAEPLSMIAL